MDIFLQSFQPLFPRGNKSHSGELTMTNPLVCSTFVMLEKNASCMKSNRRSYEPTFSNLEDEENDEYFIKQL